MADISNYILIVITIIGIPIALFICLKISNRRKNKNFIKYYSEYLNRLDDKNFFCYNNREGIQEFIETYIIPELSKEVEVIFLNGKVVESNYPVKFISHTLYNLKNYTKFPHLIKIRNGQVFDISLNNTFYNIISQKRSLEILFNEMNIYFDLEEK